ncbi:fluoride efflux transporter FluC [Streptomyces sp. NPDC090798]|uniref:fluoride efflux transporter FluC n=1 Tax=Streptomyces sp. NPDC090798 TaxID=3365968 RepID=UPI00380F053F
MRANESGPERESREPPYISGAAPGGDPAPGGVPTPGGVPAPPGGDPAPSREPFRSRLRKGVLAAVALGGVLGGWARYALGLTFPTPPGTFPLTTFAINVSGAFLLALLLVYVLEIWPPTRYVRPFAGVGFLGAYTTFSTWMVDTDRLLGHGKYAVAAFNVFGSLLAGLVATGLGLAIGRMALARRERLAARHGRARRYGWWVR